MFETLLAGLHTAKDVKQLRDDTKERLITLIEAHFVSHPGPVCRLEEEPEEGEKPKQLNVLDYPIDTRKFEGVSIVELHAQGFIYEPEYSDRGWEGYCCLSLDELLDVLDVLEKHREPVAEEA